MAASESAIDERLDRSTAGGPDLSLIFAYYNQPQMLDLQLRIIEAWPVEVKQAWEVVVIDDGSREAPAEIRDVGLPVRLYRIQDDAPWNVEGARNIGVHEALGHWLLVTDIDHLVSIRVATSLAARHLDPGTVYFFERTFGGLPHHPHPNSFLLHRFMWNSIGGFDERLSGIYGGSNEWRTRAARLARFERLPLHLDMATQDMVPDAWVTSLDRATPENRVLRAEAMQNIKENPGPLTMSFAYERIA